MAAVEELGALLHSLQALKAPGVTPSKIKEITQKAVENVQVRDYMIAVLPRDMQYYGRTKRKSI